jgi:adenosylmethionine---8-amino-7-oxononanoate aminotransferase
MKDWQKMSNKVVVSAENFYLIDINGKRYLDGIASMWCNVWGHGQNEVTIQMIKQMKKFQHSTLFGLSSRPSIMLAEYLLKLCRGMDRVFFSDNGSTAVEVAMKMAIQYWRNKGNLKKTSFISLKRGYHGDTIGAMTVGYVREYFGAYKSLLKRTHRVPSPALDNDNIETSGLEVERCLEQTECILKKYGSSCCALIMESGAQIAGGVRIFPDNYQKEVAKLCKKYDVLLILDEIATAFGRLGNMIEYIAQESFPDIVCLGKALSAGYSPLAATLTTNKIFEAFLGQYGEKKHLYHGHTFTGHAIGCTAAIANLKLYKKYKLIEQIYSNSQYIKKSLREIKKSPIVKHVRCKGLLAALDLVKHGTKITYTKDKVPISYFIMQQSLRMGVILRPLWNTITIIPPLAMKRNDLIFLMDVITKLIDKVENQT